jgi:hypothetical protein
MKKLESLDRFYLVFAIVIMFLSALVGMTAMKLFESFRIANDVDTKFLDSSMPRLNEEQLQKARAQLTDHTIKTLDY